MRSARQTSIETDYRGARPFESGHRLGCAATVCGDVVVDVPPASQVHRQVVRKDLDLPPIIVDPSFTLWYVEVPKSELGDESSAAGSLARAVAEQHGRHEPFVPFGSLAALQPVLARSGGDVTVAIDESNWVVAIWPGFVDRALGVAVDIGSTTIAGHLCDVTTGEVLASAGRMNPQIRYGEDLMSRVSYVMMNPGGDRDLTEAVRTALDGLIGDLVDQVESFREDVLEIVLVGNPIMHHVLLGIDPTPLGQAPFTLATNRAITTRASDLDLVAPNARCYVGPCIAGHVGADTAAAILAEGPHRSDGMQLLVDIGTNAEIVLGDTDRQFAASSPTGPAFEGAQISSGQRATAGAIESVRIDPVTLEPQSRRDRRRRAERRPGLRLCSGVDRRHRHLRFGHHRCRRRDVPRRHHRPRGCDPRRARRTDASSRRGRPHLLLRAVRRTATTGSPSPRTTSGRSSSPRRHFGPASTC